MCQIETAYISYIDVDPVYASTTASSGHPCCQAPIVLSCDCMTLREGHQGAVLASVMGPSHSGDAWLQCQHLEPSSADHPGCKSRVGLMDELPGPADGAMVLTMYGMPRRERSRLGSGMLQYVLSCLAWWWKWGCTSCTFWISTHLVIVSMWRVSSAFTKSAVLCCVTTQL